MSTSDVVTEAITRRIAASYERNRIAGELVGNVLGNADPHTIHRIHKCVGEWQVSTSPSGGVTMAAPRLTVRDGEVDIICLEQKGDFREFFSEDRDLFVDTYLDHLGMQVAHQENNALISGLIREAKDEPTNQGGLTRSGILDAAKSIDSKQCWANVVVVNSEQEFELIRRKEIISRWCFSPQQWVGKDQHCCGILDGMDVYSTSHMPAGLALVYDKSEAFLSRTPLIIRFDDSLNPKRLLVEERCVVWVRNDNAITKICLRAEFCDDPLKR